MVTAAGLTPSRMQRAEELLHTGRQAAEAPPSIERGTDERDRETGNSPRPTTLRLGAKPHAPGSRMPPRVETKRPALSRRGEVSRPRSLLLLLRPPPAAAAPKSNGRGPSIRDSLQKLTADTPAGAGKTEEVKSATGKALASSVAATEEKPARRPRSQPQPAPATPAAAAAAAESTAAEASAEKKSAPNKKNAPKGKKGDAESAKPEEKPAANAAAASAPAKDSVEAGGAAAPNAKKPRGNNNNSNNRKPAAEPAAADAPSSLAAPQVSPTSGKPRSAPPPGLEDAFVSLTIHEAASQQLRAGQLPAVSPVVAGAPVENAESSRRRGAKKAKPVAENNSTANQAAAEPAAASPAVVAEPSAGQSGGDAALPRRSNRRNQKKTEDA